MKNQKNNKGIIILLILIIIILVVLCALFATGTIKLNKNLENEINDSIKIYDDKDYLYDAEYKYNNEYTDYSTGDEFEIGTIEHFGFKIDYKLHQLDELKVPYININSDDARKANQELEQIYIDYAKAFDDYAYNELIAKEGPTSRQILSYFNYQYNDILSVVVFYDTQATSPWVFNYKVYNFDLNTGNIITYNEMINKLEYNPNTVIDEMKKALKQNMDEVYGKAITNDEFKDLSKACKYSNDENGNSLYGTVDCYEINYKLLQKSINDNTLLFITDNEGNLNILPILYIDFVQNGDRNHYLTKVNKK